MLQDYLTKERIAIQVKVEDWEGAVRAGGELMVEAGLCEPRYVEAMVQAVKDMGPYLVLAPGIALAHARPEDGMLAVGMSLITLADPVEFGSEANDPVRLVISFGGVDKEKHVGMLQELSRFLVEEGNQQLLMTAESVEDVLTALESQGQE